MLIRIARRPIGEAPEWVRDAWIGLSLPTPQKSIRTFRAFSAVKSRTNPISWIIGAMRGESFRVSGFMVNGKTAVDLLAQTQPPAAEWWRSNAPKSVTGRQYLVFDADCCEPLDGKPFIGELLWGSRRFRDAYPASPGRIALLWMITTIVRIAMVVIFPGEDMHSVSSILYQSGTPVLAAFLAGWALQLRGSILHLLAALISLDLVMTIIIFGTMVITPELEGARWILPAFYFLIIAVLIGGWFANVRSKRRRTAAILLIILTNMGAGHLQSMDGMFWYLSAQARPLLGQPVPSDREEADQPEIEPDILWEAQPRLIQKEISGLRFRVGGASNIYSVAVAGSGTQAIFSREAHEALRVAAHHFGSDSRGGAILSSGADDLMKTPLATRSNIAATVQGIAAKADRQHDLLFVYLASHGSRTAELASEMSDYHLVQPISAVSTADALRKAGISHRVIVVSACFAASWIPALANDDTIVIAAAARDRTSFGCDDSRRLTLFGESFLGSLNRQGISLHDAFEDAKRRISAEEAKEKITASLPQAYVGRNMQELWLRTKD